MSTETSNGIAASWDVIVIGSGMGGMVAGAALSRQGHQVLLLEQYDSLGGQTHSFSRDGFRWDAGACTTSADCVLPANMYDTF